MQVSVEQTSELSRTMTISIPEEIIQEKVSVHLKSLKNNVRIDGFRPGKIPQSLINKRYGTQARAEVKNNVIQTSYHEALKQENLKPVNMPHIEPIGQEQDKGLNYTAEFEVYPQISLAELANIEVKRPISKIEATDFEAMLQQLRQHKTQWHAVERATQNHDQLTLNFSGICDGENFTELKDFKIQIGSKQMPPGFEDQLLALKVGSNKQFELSFPENYTGNPSLSGKLASFDVEVLKIEEPCLPEINQDFIKDYGIESGDREAFYADIKLNMENELNSALTAEIKRSVFDALYTHIKITLPKALVGQEVIALRSAYLNDAKLQNRVLEDLNLKPDLFEDQARRKISLGLILDEIIQKNNLTLDNQKLQDTINNLTQHYDLSDEAMKSFYEDQTQLNKIKQLVLENQTVDWLMKEMMVIDEPRSFKELITHHHRHQGI